ncbi:pyridoxamine 5'-phosphate oxidase [Streptomyces desertarenae]|uniref:Pyridoxamine 5'-phosphate oxidase n=1 Tax=Streptomyces desertarenae TaxID=2666184 RepID=A0ABW4PDJ2_9ACTN
MTSTPPAPRTAEQRRRDVLARLEEDTDARVSTAGPCGAPCLVPLSFLWYGGAPPMSTRGSRPAVRNLRAVPRARVAPDRTRDVVLIDARAGAVPSGELPAREAAFAAKPGRDPHGRPAWVCPRLRGRGG